jgi:hypothetical protein
MGVIKVKLEARTFVNDKAMEDKTVVANSKVLPPEGTQKSYENIDHDKRTRAQLQKWGLPKCNAYEFSLN